MLTRVLEPEVMDDQQEASEYDSMDHSVVNSRFVTDLLDAGPLGKDVLDLGTGTALIPVELCLREKSVRVMASDASIAMLDLARYNIEIKGLIERIQLHVGDAKKLVFEDNYFDTVMSNSLVHHLPDIAGFFDELMRVIRPGGLLFIRDLCRPVSNDQVESLVATYAGNETAHSQQLLRQSLQASFTVDEIREFASIAGIDVNCVNMSSDRHWTLIARKK